jgi:hypothetical protein
MKNIFIAASLLLVSCNYKSESDKEFERVILMSDCTMISSNRALIELNEITLDAVLRTIKARGKATPEEQKQVETIPKEIDSLKAEIDKIKAEMSIKTKQQ